MAGCNIRFPSPFQTIERRPSTLKKTADQDSAPQISVIMPVYNTEEFMEESLASLLAQTFQDYELIMVDDESTDASGKIADLYAGRYENFSAYHVPNG